MIADILYISVWTCHSLAGPLILTETNQDYQASVQYLFCHRRPGRMLGKAGNKRVVRCLYGIIAMINGYQYHETSYISNIFYTYGKKQFSIIR